MDKRVPHHDLARVKRVLGRASSLSITTKALIDATALGFDRKAIAAVMAGLAPGMFYKSTSSIGNDAQWQDVYHVPLDDELTLYVKFRDDRVTEFHLLSFKRK